jgi:DNA-binding CsgD family transcriptional regulator
MIRNWPILAYGVVLGLLLIILRYFHYRFLLVEYSAGWYGGFIALFFTAVGIWAGVRWNRPETTAVFSETQPIASKFQPNDKVIGQLKITPREFEVLQLISQGLSNQEIAAMLFVSLNTVKTHTANVFDKLDVQRRIQAVQKAKSLGLLP